MRSLLAIGVAIILLGCVMMVFGAVYSSSIDFGTEGNLVSFYLYPIWSPPTLANYAPAGPPASCNSTGITQGGAYHPFVSQSLSTPLNPIPSCLYPPILGSANYTLNLVGVILLALGIALTVRTSTQHLRIDSPEQRPST